MSKKKILPPVPHNWDDSSDTLDYYRRVATRSPKKDIGYLYKCLFLLEQEICQPKEEGMSVEVMDQLAEMQKQIDVLAAVVKKLMPKPAPKKKPAAKKASK